MNNERIMIPKGMFGGNLYKLVRIICPESLR